jgi:integrase
MAINKLSPAEVKNAVAGMHGDGGGLWLQVTSGKHGIGKSWSFRYTVGGKQRQMGLGAADAVPMAKARVLAAALRTQVADGVDPLAAKEAAKDAATSAPAKAVTFEQAARLYQDRRMATWRSAKHGAQWLATLVAHAFPVIGGKPVADVAKDDVKAILEPLWKARKVETGSRVRGRIETVLNYAAVEGWRPEGFNPATWKGNLAISMPKPKVELGHHAALPWRAMPPFMADLASRDGASALALRFAILTAARSGEVRGATWGEIDLQTAMWTVPGNRMKAGKDHRVPLSSAALAILTKAATLWPVGAAATDLVFPGRKFGIPLSDMSLTAVLRRMGRGDLTAHGFRSTFRVWAAETSQAADLAEAALAHTAGDKTVLAYLRTDLAEQRRPLMTTWADYCGSATVATVDAA